MGLGASYGQRETLGNSGLATVRVRKVLVVAPSRYLRKEEAACQEKAVKRRTTAQLLTGVNQLG